MTARGRDDFFAPHFRTEILVSPHDVLTTLVLQTEPSFV